MRWIPLSLILASNLWAACEPPAQMPTGLTVRDGYTDFMTPSDVAPWKQRLPKIGDAEIDERMRSPDTMFYDEASMVFLYQDSIETVTGGRANCVGRKVGENNVGNPAIHKLVNYFGPDYKFMFPFRTAAGTDDVTNVRVLNFWSPPYKNGKAMPVKYWRPSSRSRWYWTFPIGTLFGEVLFEKSPDGNWYPFELRTRKRYRDGWEPNVFRPFPRAEDLAKAIESAQPGWAMSVDLKKLMTHLRDNNTLVSARMESPAFGKVFKPIDGSLDPLPAVNDYALIGQLLSQTTFVSTEGKIWKENAKLQTYAPASQGDFHVVPKGYKMGLIPVNEVSCNRCHSETGRRLLDFEWDIQLYGEVWGEDRLFTWHLFEPHRYIYDTWDDSDGSRKLNPRLASAKLVQNQQPAAGDPDYKALPGAYVPETRRIGHE